MANTQDLNQSLKGLLSDHFFDITDSAVTNVQQDANGDFVFHLAVRATPKKPGGGGGHNAKPADTALFKAEDFTLPAGGTGQPTPTTDPAPSGGLRKEDIINIAVAAATAAVAAAAQPADDGDGKGKKPGGGGGHNANAPVQPGIEQQ